MRKFNLYCIVAFVSAMVLSVSSCTKDLEDDVDALKKEVAANKDAIKALQDAINSGSVITKVETVAEGFKITFSDNKSITVTNGRDGATGATGGTGATGLPGNDGYAPVLKVNADGNWTVQTVKDGEFVVMTDAAGLPIKAKGEDGTKCGITISEDGFIMVGDVKTSIGTPSVVKNLENNTLTITIWDSSLGKYENYTLPLVGEGGMVASLRTPASKGYKITLQQGKVTSTLVGGPFAGAVTKDEILINGIFPVIVNPSNATVVATSFSLENTKGEKLGVKFINAVKGFEGSISTRAAESTNGITALTVASNTDKIIVDGTDFALKYTLGGDNAIYSTYDYDVDATNALALNLSDVRDVIRIGTPVVFNGKTAEDALFEIDPMSIYMQKITLHSDSEIYASYIDFGADGNTITAKTDAASIKALAGKTVKFVYSVLDYTGACKGYTAGVYSEANALVASIIFYDSNFAKEYSLLPITHTLSSTNKTATADLATLFTQLGTEGTAYWKANAKTFTYEYEYKDVTDNLWKTSTVISAGRLLKADGQATTTASEAVKVEFTIDEATALPSVDYRGVIKFVDNTEAGKETFTINTEIKVVNPAIVIQKKSAVFSGSNLTIYGDAQDNITTNSYTLSNAYNVIADVVLSFETIAEDETLTAITGGKVMITKESMNKPINVKVTGTLFGNAKNVVSEIIVVTPKSSIKTGKMTETAGKLTLTYDQTIVAPANAVALSGVLKMLDAETKAVAFLTATNDSRLAKVTVVAGGANKDLIKITEANGEQTVTIVYTTQNIPSKVVIPITITLTDQYGEEYIKTVDFTITPKA